MKEIKINSILFYNKVDTPDRNQAVIIPRIEALSNEPKIGDIITINRLRYRLIAKFQISSVFVGELIDDVTLHNPTIKLRYMYVNGICYYPVKEVKTVGDPTKFKLFKF